MKKKLVCLIMAAVLLLSGCCLSHEWEPANCESPKTCTKCEKTEGETLGHNWVAADCITPKTCTLCGASEGETLGHQVSWTASTEDFAKMTGICTVCAEELTEDVDWYAIGPNFLMGNWDAYGIQIEDNLYDLDEGITFEIREDGTATLDLVEKKVTLTWQMTQAECYDEEQQTELLLYTFTEEEGSRYTLAATYFFGKEVTSIYLYVGDKVMVFQK